MRKSLRNKPKANWNEVRWPGNKAAFEAERQKLKEARRELESRQNWRDWLQLALLVAGMIGIGIAIGMWIAR